MTGSSLERWFQGADGSKFSDGCGGLQTAHGGPDLASFYIGLAVATPFPELCEIAGTKGPER